MQHQYLSLAFSPCPNDTFMFDALAHHRIDTEGLHFNVHLADVEALNHAAMRHTYDITKLSYHAYAYVEEQYAMLPAGSALGFGNGPLLVSARALHEDELATARVAVAGRYTTSVALLKAAFPQVADLRETVFSNIERMVLCGDADAGVLIHEGRFTYAQKGLHLIADLGARWEEKTRQPVPLGGIAMRRTHPEALQQTVTRVLRRSIEYALAHPDAGAAFVRKHAQEMDGQVIKQHIALYVNRFSLDLGDDGREAVHYFLKQISVK
ncbi:MAG: 1,4-dihydroxy-6-naphthoate synthase [Prevotellaceae bacterium]|jgi:1,4-dihydroxy-6-naphthoate synthase|nr:1,4-dihydroxy-6-naphthoate synthase [Prevotellaceae bacterium]